MVFVTGDCHGDFKKFSTGNFPQQKEMTRADTVIVCGDFGIWDDGADERYWLKWLSEKPFTVVFVDGNHENFDRLYSDEFPIIDHHGGKAHKIRENIYHLMRGYIFDFEGKKFFAFGGAASHDIDDGILNRSDFSSDKAFKDKVKLLRKHEKLFRVNHESWWEQELPSQEEMHFGRQTLLDSGNKVDYIITHCCPQSVVDMFSGSHYKPDKATEYFNEIAASVDFKMWYFGHYHSEHRILGKYQMLYHRIRQVL